MRTDKNSGIKIYPNPCNEILTVEFEQNVLENFELYLMDDQGKIVYSSKPIKESIVEINMIGFGRGAYILNIFNMKNKDAFINKIIYE